MKSKRLLSVLLAGIITVTACGCNKNDLPAEGQTGASQPLDSGNTAPETSDPNDISSQYEWGNVEIVGGGYVDGIYYNKAEEGLVYARTDIGGAYRMNKETGRWMPITDQFNNDDYTYYGIDGLATDEKEPNRVYLLAGMYGSWKAAVLRSDNYGETWEMTPLEFSAGGNEPNRFCDRLIIDPNDNKTLYLGSRNSGLWVSHDYGATFEKMETFPTLGLDYKEDGYNFGITAIACDLESSADGEPCKTMYVGTGDKMSYVTTDGGATWEQVKDHPVTYLPYHIYVEGNYVYFVLSNQAGPYTVTKGAIKRLDKTTGEMTDISPVDANHGWGDLEIDPANPDIMYASTMGKWGANENDCIYRTTDGGATWEGLFTGDGQNRIFEMDYSVAKWLDWGGETAKLGWMMGDIEMNPFNSDEITYGTGATVFRSKNLTKWGNETVVFEVYCEGIEETAVNALDAPNSDEIRLYSAMGDIDGFAHRDVDKAPEVLNENGAQGGAVDIACSYGNPDVVARTGNANYCISISTDGGKTWKQVRKPTKGGDSGKVAVNADGTVIYWTNNTAAAVFKSEDNGENWTQLDKPFAKAQIECDCINPDVLYVYTSGSLYISTDKGATFKSSSLFIPEGGVIVPNPEKEGELWLASNFGGVFLITDFGNGELKRTNIQSAVQVAVGAPEAEGKPMTLYAIGTNNGIYGIWRSTDQGESWQRINDDMHQFGAIGTSLAADRKVFGQVYFGSNGRGILMGRLK